VYGGLAGPGTTASVSPLVLLVVLALWVLAPLALAVLAFRRKPV